MCPMKGSHMKGSHLVYQTSSQYFRTFRTIVICRIPKGQPIAMGCCSLRSRAEACDPAAEAL